MFTPRDIEELHSEALTFKVPLNEIPRSLISAHHKNYFEERLKGTDISLDPNEWAPDDVQRIYDMMEPGDSDIDFPLFSIVLKIAQQLSESKGKDASVTYDEFAEILKDHDIVDPEILEEMIYLFANEAGYSAFQQKTQGRELAFSVDSEEVLENVIEDIKEEFRSVVFGKGKE